MARFQQYIVALLLALYTSLAGCGTIIANPTVTDSRLSLNTSTVVSRLAKPPDKYTPHDPPLRWQALGDSYTAGPCAGDSWDLPARNCYRNKGAWPVQIRDDFPIDVENRFYFEACSGDTTQDFIIQQLDKIQPNMDFIILTLGGNDAFFSQVIQTCIMGITGAGQDWDSACQAVLEKADHELRSDGFRDRLNELYKGIFSKMAADHHYHVIHVRYPKLFSNQQSDNWCDDISFLDDYSWPPIFTKPKLSYKLRQDLN
ncbi:SGNH hydrolase [Tothia fuscella]|uniref:SGNH hydrolase n=1 Tax=Tothia fuscella TaxID=1048955 RepID=A0A9P4NMN1_9PEZI|nr:SGNH hydrolase [Tothia fuscella]